MNRGDAEWCLVHAGQLLTMRGPRRGRRGSEMREAGIIEDGAVVVREESIVWVGPTDDLPCKTLVAIDAAGKVVLPGFVDSHTHPVFAGPRAGEFEWRIEGASYMDILARGGGILSSVRAVREAERLEVCFANRFLEHGTTTIEAKSGYGLTLEHEIRMLEAMRAEPLETVRTYLGAHAVPEEFRGRREAYVDQIVDDLPKIAGGGLAEFCDAFIEPGAFTAGDGRRIFERAKQLGMKIKFHADEFESSGGAELAVELGAVSADHLGAITAGGIQAVASSDVVATLLPATLFMLGRNRYAPARALIDAGAVVALATDFNPGTAPTVNMQLVLSLACTQMRMTPAETIVAATINGAAAVSRAGRLGSIEPGKQADFAVYGVRDYREIPYYAGMNLCQLTIKRGQQAFSSRTENHEPNR